jgi:hypothetical protein
MGAIAHVEPALDVNAVSNELVNFGEQSFHVEHNPIADGTANAGMEYSARNLMEHERLVGDVDGVAGVCTALVADHPVRSLGKDIDELAFTFVPPLSSNDDDRARIAVEHSLRFAPQRERGIWD